MSYQVTDQNGITTLRPDHKKMVFVVQQMYRANEEDFVEVTLTHASGVAVSLYPNGTAVLDTPDSNTYSILEDLTMNEQLMLWVQLAAGNIDSLNKLDWQKQGWDI